MTDISVHSVSYYPEDLSWNLTNLGDGYVEGLTLDVTKVDASLYPHGFVPSGTLVAVLTTGGLAVPYLYGAPATDGSQIAVGLLVASAEVVRRDGTLATKIGISVLKAFGAVSVSKLPWTSAQTKGGYFDSHVAAALPHIHFAA